MSLFLCLLVVLPFVQSLPYGIIRNKSLDTTSTLARPISSELNTTECEKCLCHAFSNQSFVLFTCERIPSTVLVQCQFYSSFPYLDVILSTDASDIYLLKNHTFRQRNDCCNTDDLVEQIRLTPIEHGPDPRFLRFLVRVEDQMLITSSINSTDTSRNFFLRFFQSNMSVANSNPIGSLISVGYCQGNYYLATLSNQIQIFDRDLRNLAIFQPIPSAITSIRFLHGGKMLVATNSSTIYMFDKGSSDTFNGTLSTLDIPGSTQLYGIAAVSKTSFYTGVNAENNTLRLFVQEGTGWNESVADRIEIGEPISDLVLDNCQRVWAVGAKSKTLFIYEKGNPTPFTIPLNVSVFNLVILENYMLMMTHGTAHRAISRIQPNLSCNQPLPRTDPSRRRTFLFSPSLMNRFDCSYMIHPDDWRPTQQTLITRFRQIYRTDMYRTINQDYGSFYHRPISLPCYPDRLKAKIARRHDRFLTWMMKQRCNQVHSNEPITLIEENNDQSSIMISSLSNQIFQRVKTDVDPADVSITYQCITLLVHDLLSCNPFLSSNEVIEQVLRIITARHSVCTDPVHPPSCGLFPLSSSEENDPICC